MIKVFYKVPKSLRDWVGAVDAAGRRDLFSAAAAAVSNLVRRHIAADAPRRHNSASRLGATPTGFMEAAARKTVFHADEQHGEVVIPSPGFGRAFHDVEITPTKANRLTIPISAHAYGHRVSELRSFGWKFFQGLKGHEAEDILFGYRGKGKDREVKPLYVLKNYVRQAQDRSLLPSDAAIGTTAARAMMAWIQHVGTKAGITS